MNFLTKQTLKALLEDRFKDDSFKSLKDLPSPFLLKDAQKAAQIIIKGMKENQKILIAGDYDADGISACAIMLRFFKMIGYKNITHIIPNRFNDGYGITKKLIEKIPADIIITVDNGISAFEVGQYCKENNITLIITDHHAIEKTLPLADAIINPQQSDCAFPQKQICGASVAWYLCNAIKIEMGLELSLACLLDLVALATIADVMPLVKVNKILVRAGLAKFIKCSRPANEILKDSLKNKALNTQSISFHIAPLINSAGRMEDGNIALNFLLEESKPKAKELYCQLEALNSKRKKTSEITLELAKKSLMVGQSCLIAHGEGWHEGLLGIVAVKLSGIYKKPAIVLTEQENILKGSGRSYDKINLLDAIQKHSKFLNRFGGHSKAVGLELNKENLVGFFEALKDEKMSEVEEKTHNEVLGFLDIKKIDEELLRIIESFEPYGEGNPEPIFECKGVEISSSKPIKEVHQKLEFKNSKTSAIQFYFEEALRKNDKVDIVFSLQRNNFDKQPSIIVKSITKCPL